jgi:cytosine/uracil/thiamine/allantoin permease
MEDFIRLNLMTFITLLGLLIMLIFVYCIVMKYVPNENKNKIKMITVIIIFLIMFGTAFWLIKQVAVNNIPRNVIDRTYLDNAQQKYQNNLNKKGEKE